MSHLLDTCALSEMVQAKPNPKVLNFLSALPVSFVCSISVGEIRYGIELLPVSAKRKRLESWYENWVLPYFRGRVLSNDLAVMERWGTMMVDLERRGFKMQIKDSLIAACALQGGMTVVTRNESDFVHSGVQMVNPWKF